VSRFLIYDVGFELFFVIGVGILYTLLIKIAYQKENKNPLGVDLVV
jgi:hypothetical protein